MQINAYLYMLEDVEVQLICTGDVYWPLVLFVLLLVAYLDWQIGPSSEASLESYRCNWFGETRQVDQSGHGFEQFKATFSCTTMISTPCVNMHFNTPSDISLAVGSGQI